MSVVSILLFAFVNSMTNVTARTDSNVRAEQEAQNALRVIGRDIRAASPIIDSAGCDGGFGDCLRFDIRTVTDFTRSCERDTVTYRLNRTNPQTNPQTITRDVQRWIWNAGTSSCIAGTAVTGAPVIGSLRIPPGTPLFVYSDRRGGLLPSSDAACASAPTPACKIVSAPSSDGTAGVRIDLVVQYHSNAPTLNLSSNAVLRNGR
jgi:hypothetical protein